MRSNQWAPSPRPSWVLEVNHVGSGQKSTGIPLVSFDLGSLHRDASLLCGGLTDFGGDDYLVALSRLVLAIEKEADFHLAGALASRDEIVNALHCRLWLTDLYRRHPEIEHEVLARPIFVGGLGRSGTSIVHETLAAAPDVASLATWEMRAPWIYEIKEEQRTQAKDEAWRAVQHSWYGLAPDLEIKHQMGRDMPQECTWVLNHGFATDYFAGAFMNAPQYMKWMTSFDKTPLYEYYKRFLKAIQWLRGGEVKQWVLKAPMHTFNVETIFKVFPDAHFVWTHRDPIKGQSSGISFRADLVYSRSNKMIDTCAEGQEILRQLPAFFDWVMALDKRTPPSRLSHVVYKKFMTAPVEVLAEVRANAGLPNSQNIAEAMRRFLEGRPQHARGVHSYDFSVLGISDLAEARKPFLHYQEYFGVESEW